MAEKFNILAIVQGGRLQYEAVLLAASLRESSPGFSGRLILAEPQPNERWQRDPRINNPDVKALLLSLGAEIVPFENRDFGESYPNANKLEALTVLPQDEPFVFFDTDTLFLDDLANVAFDFDRPSASMRREGSWPEVELYGPGYTATWKSLFDRFELDFTSSLDTRFPDEYWERYLYFNAGWFFSRNAGDFERLWRRFMCEVRDDPPRELVCQSLDPWLDQVTLPLVIHALGGGRPAMALDGLDGDVTCHWRVLPLMYARESDRVIDVLERVAAPNKIKKVIKQYEPIRRMIYQGRGQRVRAMFDRNDLPRPERQIRNQIKAAKLWRRGVFRAQRTRPR